MDLFARWCEDPDTQVSWAAVTEALESDAGFEEEAAASSGLAFQISWLAYGSLSNLIGFGEVCGLDGPPVASPLILGAGRVASSLADVIWGDCLLEVKSVARPFHQPDLRQIMTYCALEYLQPEPRFSSLALVNPRRGVFVKQSAEWIFAKAAGMSPFEFGELISIHAGYPVHSE